MPARPPNQLPFLALKRAHDPVLISMFKKLCDRSEAFAKLEDQFNECIVKHREAREGKPFRLTKGQERLIQRYEKDAEEEARNLERILEKMDDVQLVVCALMSQRQQLGLDERLHASIHDDDREMAHRLLDYQRSSIAIIETAIHEFHRRAEVDAVLGLMARIATKPCASANRAENLRIE